MMNNINSGTFCPACKMKNESGALICSYCNTPLENNNQNTVSLQKLRETTGTLPDYFDEVLDAPTFNAERFMDFEIPSKGIVLISLEDGQPIAMRDEKEFILGRASAEIKTSKPLVDLTNFDALDNGISRIHAIIRQTGSGYQISDLESTNGTWHENQRLTPRQPQPLESGDRIRIGRLHMLVFYPGVS